MKTVVTRPNHRNKACNRTTPAGRWAAAGNRILLVIFSVSLLGSLRAGVEQVQRDFQARYHLVSGNYLHKERGENFGNARLVRNCFEAVINGQASRLAASGTFDARALTMLEALDLNTPAQNFLEGYRNSRKGYVVKCPGCGQVYSWSPDLDIIDAVCTKCGKTYNCEFGELQP